MAGMTYVPAADRYDADALPPLRPQRPQAARDLARPVAELRRRPAARHAARDRAPRVRPRHHALRPGQQLRAAVRLGRGELRAHPGPRPAAVPRRAGHLDQGRLRHVARPVRRVGLAQVPAGEPRPEPRSAWASTTSTSSTRTASTRTRRSRRRWARSTRRCSRARRCTPASRPTRPSGPPRRRAILRDLGTPLLIHQPSYSLLNRWIEEDLLDVLGDEGVGASPSRRSPRGCSPTKYLDGVPEDSRAAARTARSRPDLLTDEDLDARRALNEIARAAGRRWPRWRSPGRCATRASPRADRRQQRRASSRTTSARSRRPDFTDDELADDRPPRRRRRDQPLGAVERALTVRPRTAAGRRVRRLTET